MFRYSAAACMPALLLLACSRAPDSSDFEPTHDLEDLFAIVATFELKDEGEPPFEHIEIFAETANGDLLVADAVLPRLRRYDPDGRLLAELVSADEGTFEIAFIGGLLEDRERRVIVVDPRLGRIVILDDGFEADTAFTLAPWPTGAIFGLRGGYLVATRPSEFHWMTDRWRAAWALASPIPRSVDENPYWSGYAAPRAAVSASFIVTGYSYGYPLRLYDVRGALIDSIGRPPPSFRSVTVVPVGAFTGVGGADRRERWLRSFDAIAHLAILDDRVLVVTHGELRLTARASPISTEHHRIDVYDLRTRTKIAEDVRLPAGSRMLGAGRRGLYVLTGGPPNAWMITRLVLAAR
jgi:hypothetical protein